MFYKAICSTNKIICSVNYYKPTHVVLKSDMFCRYRHGRHKVNMFYLTLTILITNVTLTHCCEITEREHNVINVIAYTPLIKACIRKFGENF